MGYTLKKLANILGITEGTVHVRERKGDDATITEGYFRTLRILAVASSKLHLDHRAYLHLLRRAFASESVCP